MNRAQPSGEKQPAKAVNTGEPNCAAPDALDAERSLNSADILRGAKAVAIQHQGSTYRLHATKQGKLILTK
jgi:hemin uptake protein HemP